MVDTIPITGFVTNAFSDFAARISEMPANETIIFDIAIILIISAIFAFLARVLRQPLIPAYVLAGLLIGPVVLGFVQNIELIYAFSEIGIAFLLFTAGLEISFKKIKQANLKKILLVGTIQVVFIILLSILLGSFFNLSTLQAAYIGIIMAFGSTMVDIKLLSDKNELITLHGRIVLGILLLQDFVAILAIVVFMTGGFMFAPIVFAIGKLILLVAVALLLQRFVLNPLFKFAARSTELLFLSALAVLFLFIILTYLADLSIVIGAFIAGVSLANSPFKLELESRVSPLRDFFAILFFVALGMQIVFSGIGEHLALFFFLIAGGFIIKPLLTFFLVRFNGYRSKTSFLTSISLAQLSEFSLIIGMLGVTLGALSQGIFSVVILATIITMSVTPYFIEYKEQIYRIFKTPLKAFKFLPIRENLEYKDEKDKSVIIAGCHRMGSIILKELADKGKKDDILVIDYNPEIISALINKKVSCIYGDLGSPDMLENLDFNKLKMVVSTIPNHEENLHLLGKIKERNKKVEVILASERIDDALDLYEKGADYVILPKVIAGDRLINIIHDKPGRLKNERKEHIKKLKHIHNILY